MASESGLVHFDTDLLIVGLSRSGAERRCLLSLADSPAVLQMSAVAWYEFSRGPRTPEQLAVGRALLADDGIIPLSEDIASRAAEVFRQLGSPRRRAADIAIASTAIIAGATLVTRNSRDFADIPGLDLCVVAE